jgi:MoaA/NifB/PqqE/SkfB family radical SAM enzyme
MSDRLARSLHLITAHDAQRPRRAVPARPALEPRSTFRQDATASVAKFSGASTEPDLFNILIFNYTMQCPLACDYCCYGCSPKRTETMDRSLALDLVDQAAELGVFAQCGFTGGEALLHYDDVMAITARMQQRRLPFSMISSCYWATDAAQARRVIGDLAAHGMAVFTATHDPSHENWVPIASIRLAVDAALEAGVHVCICGFL